MGIEERVCTLEQRVAEHDLRLETVCSSLDRVVVKLDAVCEKLTTLVGAQAERTKHNDMLTGGIVAFVVSLILYVMTE